MLAIAYFMFPSVVQDRRFSQPFPQFPAPVLQPSPVVDMDAFRTKEMNRLNSAGWLDRAAGKVHIPIDQAMRAVAGRGHTELADQARCRGKKRRRPAVKRLLLALLLLPVAACAADDLTAYGWQQHPGSQLKLETGLRDEAGRAFSLSGAFGGPPVILDLDYYHCPSLCGVVRHDLFNALHNSGLTAGRDYRLVSLSIDPAETAADAAQAKLSDLAYASITDGTGWHYLIGSAEAVAAIADTVGFRDRYDEPLKQFLHPAGIVVLTGAGVVSSYLLGVGFTAGDLRAALLRAGDGGVAQASLPILLLCFHYDALTGRYTLAVEKVLRLMAGLTVVTMIGLFVVLQRQPNRS